MGAGAEIRGVAPALLRRIDGGTFFVEALPKSACAYGSLIVGGQAGNSTFSMSHQFGSCRPGRRVALAVTGSPNAVSVMPPSGLSHAQLRAFTQGEVVVGEAGCLACHTIGSNGNNGPGPPLSRIGSVLRPAAIRSALLNPAAPMPSFGHLPKRELRALVSFLSRLRR